jgi:hypothetical protein
MNRTGPAAAVTDMRGKRYAGSDACAGCHKNIHANYEHTEHAHTSWPVKDFPADIRKPSDTFYFSENNKVIIEKRDSGIFQVAYEGDVATIAKRFDIGFGSGEKAYTFGYWEGKNLNELPLSYFTTIHQWANSPGFPQRKAYFERPIIRRCFECHSSFVAPDLKQTESFSNVRKLDPATVIYGIDCERCHGPAAEHVSFHQQNPSVKESHNMVSWKTLSREQRLDACGVCHSGNDLTTQFTTFAFKPGDTLSNFYYPEFGPPAANPDVHGKQVQLLSASQCFIKSKALECSSCHNSHDGKEKNMTVYAQQCINCHQNAKHPAALTASLGNAITDKCIDCHMPNEASKIIGFREKGKDEISHYFLRTHRIAIYPEEVKKILNELKNNKIAGDNFAGKTVRR